MKTMTCKQIGGPCDTPISGSTPKEMLDNGTKHVMEMDDDGHKKVLQMMNEMMADVEASKKWNDDFEKKFAALPEDN